MLAWYYCFVYLFLPTSFAYPSRKLIKPYATQPLDIRIEINMYGLFKFSSLVIVALIANDIRKLKAERIIKIPLAIFINFSFHGMNTPLFLTMFLHIALRRFSAAGYFLWNISQARVSSNVRISSAYLSEDS